MSNTMQMFRCQTCGAEYNTQKELEDHQRTAHQGAQGLQCSECGMTFPTRTQLEEHKQLEHQLS